MIDGLTGWTKAILIEDQCAVTVAYAVYAEWIARHGVPKQIHLDRGTQFKSALFKELCTAFGIDNTCTTLYRTKANGKCENFNRTLITMLRCAVQKRLYDSVPLLPAVMKVYRSTPSESSGFTPSRLVFKREMRLPINIDTHFLSTLVTFVQTRTS